MQSEKSRNLDFEANLNCSAGSSFAVSCKLRLPLAGWDGASVEIGLPHNNKIEQIKSPCTITGTDFYGRAITLNGLFYKSLVFQVGRKTGFAEMEIAHIDQLKIQYKYQAPNGPRNLQLMLGAHKFLTSYHPIGNSYSEEGESEELFTLDLPNFGPSTFFRVWQFYQTGDKLRANAGCSFLLSIHNESCLMKLDQAAHEIRTALVIPSIFWRQRISVLGWAMTLRDGNKEEVWSQPLDPIETKSTALAHQKYLVPVDALPEVLSAAMVKFASLSAPLQRLIELMGFGLVPFVEQRHSQRFLSLFHALEACRKFANKAPPPEVKAATEELVAVLQRAQASSVGVVKDRLGGLISKVAKGPQVDLKLELEEMFGRWSVSTGDLWPVSGPDSLPGLKQIRDRLSHNGTTAVNGKALVIATYHLSILVERIILALLEVPLDQTEVAPQKLQKDEWLDRKFVENERKLVLSQPDWA